jgi:hypothetical protein
MGRQVKYWTFMRVAAQLLGRYSSGQSGEAGPLPRLTSAAMLRTAGGVPSEHDRLPCRVHGRPDGCRDDADATTPDRACSGQSTSSRVRTRRRTLSGDATPLCRAGMPRFIPYN